MNTLSLLSAESGFSLPGRIRIPSPLLVSAVRQRVSRPGQGRLAALPKALRHRPARTGKTPPFVVPFA